MLPNQQAMINLWWLEDTDKIFDEKEFLEWLCKQKGSGIKFEYTTPDAPQQNGRIKEKFAMLHNRIRAMLNRGNHLNFWEMGYGLKQWILQIY